MVEGLETLESEYSSEGRPRCPHLLFPKSPVPGTDLTSDSCELWVMENYRPLYVCKQLISL